MQILYHDKDIAVCIKPVGLDSEKDMPAALAEELGTDITGIRILSLKKV